MPKSTFYVTTPIYYVTARPHLGSLYSTLLADVAARWNTLQGKKVFFLTGTDEHGQKVAQAAHTAGKTPQEFVDSFIPAYKNAWAQYNLGYTEFIRTTDSYHVKAVQHWLRQLKETGDIYKGEYTGFYCTPCETFVTEKEDEKKAPDAIPQCPSCGRETHAVSEQTYFFRLSKYQDKLLEFYEKNPDFITPKERIHEVINFVKSGLKDLSISRTTINWGIPFPDDSGHVTYVWADALNNYITAIGYGDAQKKDVFNKWWPADLQILGKDIVRFHAIYWPAFLMASGLALPKQLLVHGWITVGDQKMSKSLGNVVDPLALHDQYGTDPVRYYLMRKMSITHDSSFTIEDLEQTITADLANDLGNLLNRMVTLAHKYDAIELLAPKSWSLKVCDLRDECLNMLQEVARYMDEYLYHRALARLWKYIHATNTFFHAHEPWKLAATDRSSFVEVLSATAHSLHAIAVILWPVMPRKMESLLASIGVAFDSSNHSLETLNLGQWKTTFILKKIDPLFEKPEQKMIHEEKKPETAIPEKTAECDSIMIDDFAKVQLVVGTISACEPAPNSTKMLILSVDFGPLGRRTILSGVAQSYTPEQLIATQGVFVFNLKPRKMLGMESQGMMLFAKTEDGGLKMATVSGTVPNGTRLS